MSLKLLVCTVVMLLAGCTFAQNQTWRFKPKPPQTEVQGPCVQAPVTDPAYDLYWHPDDNEGGTWNTEDGMPSMLMDL